MARVEGSQPDPSQFLVDNTLSSGATSDAVKELGVKAKGDVDGEIALGSDTLAAPVRQELINEANALINTPGLPPSDIALLKSWIAKMDQLPLPASLTASDFLMSGASDTETGRQIQDLGILAEEYIESSPNSNRLTVIQAQDLLGQANALLSDPGMSPDDKAILNAWSAQVLNTLPGLLAPVGAPTDGPPSTLFSLLPRQNVYEKPSLTAILGPLMTEMADLMKNQIVSSATLEVLFMQVQNAMAKDAYNASMAAANADAANLRQQAAEHTSNATQAMVAGVIALATPILSHVAQSYMAHREGIGEEAYQQREADPARPWYRPFKTRDATMPNPTPGAAAGSRVPRPTEDLSRGTLGTREFFTSRQNATQNTKAYMDGLGQVAGQVNTYINEKAQAAYKESEADITLESGKEKAAAALIQAFISTITTGVTTMAEQGKSATQIYQSFLDMFKEFARTSTSMGHG